MTVEHSVIELQHSHTHHRWTADVKAHDVKAVLSTQTDAQGTGEGLTTSRGFANQKCGKTRQTCRNGDS